jgi:hypothetical protein
MSPEIFHLQVSLRRWDMVRQQKLYVELDREKMIRHPL